MEQDTVHILGYHGTLRSVADKIISGDVFRANRLTKNDWLGEGIYFWDTIEHAVWWNASQYAKKGAKSPGDLCVIVAHLRCNEEEYFDLDSPHCMEKLVSFARALNEEMVEKQMPSPDFKKPNEAKHFYCTFFKREYKIKLMSYTFRYTNEFNLAGFSVGEVKRRQLCATDSSIIHIDGIAV